MAKIKANGVDLKRLLSVTVPKRVESGNNWQWRPWYVYDRYKKSWFEFLRLLIRVAEGVPGGKRKVVIIAKRKKLLDKDNLIAGCKPILDFLKRWFWIRDDSSMWVETDYRQELSEKEETVIEVYATSMEKDMQTATRSVTRPES